MIQHIDFSILNFIQFYLRSDFLDHVMIGISRLGNGGAISYSFPSGHAGSSFAVATVIKFINKKFAAFVIIFSILMAFSRLYLYVHFPSDVIAGILVGISCGLLAIKIYDKFYNFIKMQKL